MSQRRPILAAAYLLLGGWGCDEGDFQDPTGPSADCRAAPLRDFCGGQQPCPDYEESVAATRAYAAGPPPICFAQLGTCGSLRYTFMGTGFTGTYRYFDSSGRLVAAETFTDAIDARDPCGGSTYYGTVTRCQKIATEIACRP